MSDPQRPESRREDAEPVPDDGDAAAPDDGHDAAPDDGDDALAEADQADTKDTADDDAEDVVVPEELMEIVRESGGDPGKLKALVVQKKVSMSEWKGPLPHPDALARYNDAYDGCARDIVGMALSQASHRQSLEMSVVQADIQLRNRGQHYGFVIAMAVIVGGLVLIAMGKSVVGFGTLLFGLASVVGLFLYSRRRQDRELAEKRASAISQRAAQLPKGG